MIKSIGLSWILVDDLKESVRFYTEILGCKIIHLDEEEGWVELSGPEGGNSVGLALKSLYEEIHPGENAIVSLPVDDIYQAKEELLHKGVRMIGDIVEYPGHLKLQSFMDVDGNCFQLIQLTY